MGTENKKIPFKRYDESHSIHPNIAVKYTVEKAFLLKEIYGWCSTNYLKGHNVIAGIPFMYNTAEAFHLKFRYLKQSSISRWLNELVKDKIIWSGNFNKRKNDKTKWYTIDFERYDNIVLGKTNPISQNEKWFSQIGKTVSHFDKALPSNNPSDTNLNKLSEEFLKDIFLEFRLAYKGVKGSPTTIWNDFKRLHKDWREAVHLLMPAYEKELAWRAFQKENKSFVPEHANLSTWMGRQRRWESDYDIDSTGLLNWDNFNDSWKSVIDVMLPETNKSPKANTLRSAPKKTVFEYLKKVQKKLQARKYNSWESMTCDEYLKLFWLFWDKKRRKKLEDIIEHIPKDAMSKKETKIYDAIVKFNRRK